MALTIPKRKNQSYRYPVPDFDPSGRYRLDDFGAPPPTSATTDPTATPPPTRAPNLNDILGGDPFYQQLLADLRAQSVADRASLREARQRALVNFGEIPDFASLVGGRAVGDLYSDITPEVRSLAEQSTKSGISTVARLEEARKDAARQLTGFLVGRGLLRSGETGFQQGRQQTDYTRSRYDATQQLLDYLAGYQASFTQAEQQRRQSEISAQQQALMNWLTQNPSAGVSPPAAPTPPVAGPKVSAAPPAPPQSPTNAPRGSSVSSAVHNGRNYRVAYSGGRIIGWWDDQGRYHEGWPPAL